jgi:hypothetical protein
MIPSIGEFLEQVDMIQLHHHAGMNLIPKSSATARLHTIYPSIFFSTADDSASPISALS